MAQAAGRPLVAEAAAAPRQAQQQQGFGQSLAGVVRMAVLWYFAMKFFSPKKPVEPSLLMSNLFHKGEPLVRCISLSNPTFSTFMPEDLITRRGPYMD